MITWPYKGESLELEVLADWFAYDGEQYASLSADAKHITGTYFNGVHFFGQGGSR